MKKLNYMAVITAGIMSACSPKVTTEMMTQSFTPQPTNKVMIYGTRDRVPEASRAIGQVQVDTRQASMKKQYTKALNLAVKETGLMAMVSTSLTYDMIQKRVVARTEQPLFFMEW